MLFAVRLQGLWGTGYLFPEWRRPVLDGGIFQSTTWAAYVPSKEVNIALGGASVPCKPLANDK